MRDYQPFRKHDNSMTTQQQYNLEAAHWAEAYRSQRFSSQRNGASDVIGIIGALLTAVGALLTLVVLCVVWVVRKVFQKG